MAIIALGLIAAPVIVYVALALVFGRQGALQIIFGPIERPVLDFATFRRDSRPNNYLVCPPDYCAAPSDAVSQIIDKPASVVRDASLALFKSYPRTTLLSGDAASMQYVFEARSLLIGFPDTVTIRFMALDDGRSTYAIYSRAHYGRSDFGVNEERVRRWLALAELSPSPKNH